jgi:hypothetical protein
MMKQIFLCGNDGLFLVVFSFVFCCVKNSAYFVLEKDGAGLKMMFFDRKKNVILWGVGAIPCGKEMVQLTSLRRFSLPPSKGSVPAAWNLLGAFAQNGVGIP